MSLSRAETQILMLPTSNAGMIKIASEITSNLFRIVNLHCLAFGSIFAHDASNYDGCLWLSSNWECEPVSALQAAANVQASAVGVGKTKMRISHLMAPDLSGSISQSDLEQCLSALTLKRQEKPCRNSTCGRMNDIGVRKCWNCECDNP